MKQAMSIQRIDTMRTATRGIVRELGFMRKGLAGTEMSPSAVHTIIELGYGTITTASDLCGLLHLEKSSVSRLVQNLKKNGLIQSKSNPFDKRSKQLTLTNEGKTLLSEIECYGRQQLRSAFNQLTEDEIKNVETGLTLFSKALCGEKWQTSTRINEVELREGYCSGIIASVAGLHASYYSNNFGFGSVFERKVATEMSEFMGRIVGISNTIFSAYLDERLLGSLSLDGEDLEDGTCHLRWFIVSPEAQGMGIGSRLLEKTTSFADAANFKRTRLWTFKGLDAARHLYEKHGFKLVHETAGRQWGKEVVEQEFERKRP